MEKIKGRYDVIVVGGGIAGVAASISAKRNGIRVCLIEKNYSLGGLATLGNVNVYLPLCDGMGKQVIKGIAEELLLLSVKDGYGKIPDCWKKEGDIEERKKFRYEVEFNPVSFMLYLEELVLKEGVEIRYGTKVCDVIKEDESIRFLIIEDKEGEGFIECKAVIDATGDADICWLSGEETVSVDKNVACGWFFYFDGEKIRRYQFTERYDPYNKIVPDKNRGFSGVDSNDITEQILKSRKYIREKINELKKENPFIFPVSIPTIPTFRMTRRLKGKIELKEEDERKIFPDSIGMCGDWRKKGPIYYIPFSCLITIRTKNLITAGRCISASTAWDIIRAIPVCALTGEISGTASAILCREKINSFSHLDLEYLKTLLIKQGNIIEKV